MDVAARHRVADPMELEGASGRWRAAAASSAKGVDVSDAVIRGIGAQLAIELVGRQGPVLDDDLVGRTLDLALGRQIAESRDSRLPRRSTFSISWSKVVGQPRS